MFIAAITDVNPGTNLFLGHSAIKEKMYDMLYVLSLIKKTKGCKLQQYKRNKTLPLLFILFATIIINNNCPLYQLVVD